MLHVHIDMYRYVYMHTNNLGANQLLLIDELVASKNKIVIS